MTGALNFPTSGTLSGASLVAGLNTALPGLATWFQGASAPTTTSLGLSSTAGVVWHDTANALLKLRNQADTAWIVLGTVDETDGLFRAAGGLQSSGQIVYTASQTLGWAQAGANILLSGSGISLTFPSTEATFCLANIGASAVTLSYPGSSEYGTSLAPGCQVILSGDGGGDWHVIAQYAPPVSSASLGGAANLKASSAGGVKTAAITADTVVLIGAGNAGYFASGVSAAVNLGASGANGLDTGSVATSTWYSLWLISNGSAVAALGSLSATAPTLPSGYTFKLRIGWARTDASANIKAYTQCGRRAQYVSNAGFPLMSIGTAGTMNGVGGQNTGAALAVSGFAPPTASSIRVLAFCVSVAGANYQVLSANAGGLGYYNAYPTSGQYQGDFNNRTNSSTSQFEITLESTSIYYVSGNSQNALYCQGWDDNL